MKDDNFYEDNLRHLIDKASKHTMTLLATRCTEEKLERWTSQRKWQMIPSKMWLGLKEKYKYQARCIPILEEQK